MKSVHETLAEGGLVMQDEKCAWDTGWGGTRNGSQCYALLISCCCKSYGTKKAVTLVAPTNHIFSSPTELARIWTWENKASSPVASQMACPMRTQAWKESVEKRLQRGNSPVFRFEEKVMSWAKLLRRFLVMGIKSICHKVVPMYHSAFSASTLWLDTMLTATKFNCSDLPTCNIQLKRWWRRRMKNLFW